VPWPWLFDHYYKLSAAFPHNARKPLPEIIDDLRPDGIWTPEIEDICKYPLDFLFDICGQTMIDEQRFSARCDKKPGFAFMTQMDDVKVGYMEFFSVPRHGALFAQTQSADAAILLSDLLLRIPPAPALKEPQRTFSIKMISDDPQQHLKYLSQQIYGNTIQK